MVAWNSICFFALSLVLSADAHPEPQNPKNGGGLPNLPNLPNFQNIPGLSNIPGFQNAGQPPPRTGSALNGGQQPPRGGGNNPGQQIGSALLSGVQAGLKDGFQAGIQGALEGFRPGGDGFRPGGEGFRPGGSGNKNQPPNFGGLPGQFPPGENHGGHKGKPKAAGFPGGGWSTNSKGEGGRGGGSDSTESRRTEKSGRRS